ncbi:MAG: hypothetical protein R2856_00605 [Caldilineaceae bacterium]
MGVLAEAVGSPSVQVLADLYHMMMDGEDLENVRTHAQWITHPRAEQRALAPGSGEYPYAEFAMLHAIGYDGLISVSAAGATSRKKRRMRLRFCRRRGRQGEGA